MQVLTTEELKEIYAECWNIMHAEYYSHREFEQAAIKIAETRAYVSHGYLSFEAFLEKEFEDAHRLSKRKYQLLKFVEVRADISKTLVENSIPASEQVLPGHERQTRSLAPLNSEDRKDAWMKAVEDNGPTPSGSQVAAAVTEQRIGKLDTNKEPVQWIDARPAPYEHDEKKTADAIIIPPPRSQRYTKDVTCDGSRLSFELIVPTPKKELRFHGYISKRQWEAIGLTYAAPETAGDTEEDFDSDDAEDPVGPSAGVKEYMLKEQRRLDSIGAPVLFRVDDPDDRPAVDAFFAEVDAPAPSFTAEMDFTELDALAKPFEDSVVWPSVMEEVADVVLLSLHLAHRKDFMLSDVIEQKFRIAQSRTWGEPDKDGVREHVREEDEESPYLERPEWEKARCPDCLDDPTCYNVSMCPTCMGEGYV